MELSQVTDRAIEKALTGDLTGRNYIAIDTETTGLSPWGNLNELGHHPARPFAVSWCYGDGTVGYRRWNVDPWTRKVLYDEKPEAIERVRKLLEDPTTIKIFHNVGFDVMMFLHAGFKINGLLLDTKALAHVATKGSEFSYALKPLCVKLFDFSDDDQTDLEYDVKTRRHEAKANGWCIAEGKEFGQRPHLADYWLGNRKMCKRYAIQDVERTMLLFQFYGPHVFADEGLKRTFIRETKLYAGPIFSMEWNGVMVFPDDVIRLKHFYGDYILEQRKEIDKWAGEKFKPRSPKDKLRYLCRPVLKDGEKISKKTKFLGLQPLHWTDPSKTYADGQPQINGEFLQHYAELETDDPVVNELRPLVRAVLETVNAAQALSNFILPYDRFMTEESQGIMSLHTHIRPTGARTGRMSCSDPNLMNTASEDTGRKRSFVGLRPRECIGPRPGTIWYLPDYSQIEVWIFAHLAGSESMMEILMSGEDFHGGICRSVWGDEKDFKERFNYYRKRGKLVMFSKLYGGGLAKQASLMDCTVDEARVFVDRYDERLPDVAKFMQRMINRIRRGEMLQNAYGRQYDIPEQLAYRATNYIIQGTAADVLKEALNNVYYNLIASGRWPEMKILLSMHDEIMMELPLKYHSKRLMREVVHEMQRAGDPLGLPVPLPVGMKIAKKRWHKTKEVPL